MPDGLQPDSDFLTQLNAVVNRNLGNEHFGVTELAGEMNMSRSNLLRKVKKETGLSVSQLISQARLKLGMELLRTTSFNVSEVSHQTGFSSTSYFIKCFREQYGYPPGEVGKRAETELNVIAPVTLRTPLSGSWKLKVGIGIVLAIVLAGALVYYLPRALSPVPIEKSIAVLPFKNESNDSTNVYLINGLMESTLNSLQKIRDLKVISRTSAEKYRKTSKSIPELARELNVRYFVEGSGQKIGNKILLNIQLIDAAGDRHLWAKQYRRESTDIFALQQEVAKNIAAEIQVVITPEESKRIAKNPTDDLVAYDLFLKGRDLFYHGTGKSLRASIPYFKKAVARDPGFALAYAENSMVYYYLDKFQTEQKYTAEMTACADKAILYDPRLAEALVAKGLSYMSKRDYEPAVPYFEKAVEYNPNSVLAINALSDYYNIYVPNTGKYLEYSLAGARIDIASHDSSEVSYIYLHLANAFVQTGFFDEAVTYIDRCISYNPKNPFAGYLRAYILYARSNDMAETRKLILAELAKDTTRVDVVAQAGSICYVMRDYNSAWRYFKHLIKMRKDQDLDIFNNLDLEIAIVLSDLGHPDQAAEMQKSFKKFADQDKDIYRFMYYVMYYAHTGEKQKALAQLAFFSKEDNYQYWVLLLRNDPAVESIRDVPEFKKLMGEIETKFWRTHGKIEERLKKKGLL